VKKKLNSFKDKLTLQQIVAGMNAANRNAKRLLDDSKKLCEIGSYSTSTALAILSIEESGKISILRELSVARNDKDIAEIWKSYRSHTSKNLNWMLTDLVAKGARKLDDLRPLFNKNSEHPYVLDQVKQIAFYTDCLGNAHW